MPKQNPFEFGRELSAAELVDRDEERAAVVHAMEEGGRLFLIGPRRFGKTSGVAWMATSWFRRC